MAVAFVAVVIVSLILSPPLCATRVYPIHGKVIYDDPPEIKWEYGDPGDDPHMGWDILGSSNKPTANSGNNDFVYATYDNSELSALILQKKYIEWIIMRAFVDLLK